jgi:hypothetical protein
MCLNGAQMKTLALTVLLPAAALLAFSACENPPGQVVGPEIDVVTQTGGTLPTSRQCSFVSITNNLKQDDEEVRIAGAGMTFTFSNSKGASLGSGTDNPGEIVYGGVGSASVELPASVSNDQLLGTTFQIGGHASMNYMEDKSHYFFWDFPKVDPAYECFKVYLLTFNAKKDSPAQVALSRLSFDVKAAFLAREGLSERSLQTPAIMGDLVRYRASIFEKTLKALKKLDNGDTTFSKSVAWAKYKAGLDLGASDLLPLLDSESQDLPRPLLDVIAQHLNNLHDSD